jgi:hypothetical protein
MIKHLFIIALPLVLIIALAMDLHSWRRIKRIAREYPDLYVAAGWSGAKTTLGWGFASWRFAFSRRRNLPPALRRSADLQAVWNLVSVVYGLTLAWMLLAAPASG